MTEEARGRRLPRSVHESRLWRIHEVIPDFRLEDVWQLPTPGGPDDFHQLVELIASLDPERGSSGVARLLFALRWKLGELLGWDDSAAGLDARVSSLRERLPADLRDESGLDLSAADLSATPFEPLYVTRDELALEIANRTVHGVLHLGWAEDEDGGGGYHGEMAVYVKRNGPLGAAYMAAIAPFRHLIVYPALLRDVGRAWQRAGEPAGG
jgi:hypothetical protein